MSSASSAIAVHDVKIKVFTGNANVVLADEIVRFLKTKLNLPSMKLGDAKVTRFSDGEISIVINENVRGFDIFVIQPTCHPVNENLMELLIMIDALKRASAARITAVIPYFGYARQDRKTESRQPITARLVADLITAAGASRVLTVDLHAGQIQGFFNIPVDNLYGDPVIIKHILSMKLEKLVIVSPDAGGTKRARRIAQALNANIAVIDKRRQEANKSEVMHVLGDIDVGSNCVIVDDICDTAGSIVGAAKACSERGAIVYACVVHPVLSGPAFERIRDSTLVELIVADTIRIPPEKLAITNKIKQLPFAELISEAIKRIHNEESVSSLFSLKTKD